eukprot:CAMPEP_0172482872 /NCGR_PEP_ID=MMETSP1066-20121228/9534_1 /TAXON_ID=671091 /ORGANISM="Coscinodiscus wailesii, Strain CCMP2513" /LENGTH=333 /DNA_ID=CAMNT_0013246351 /DNA_START=135 /DNA_END=1133 /DNA_ORIENTATION=-
MYDIREMSMNSRISVPSFSKSEIHLGSKLGDGETGFVYEIRRITLPEKVMHDTFYDDVATDTTDSSMGKQFDDELSNIRDNDDDENDVKMDRLFMSANYLRNGSARYAVKVLNPELTGDKKDAACVNLDIEAKLLAIISHPNIIKMRATCLGNDNQCLSLVLDRLYETLEEKINIWKEERAKYTYLFGVKKSAKPDFQNLKKEQLIAALDIARALRYLHRNNIIYRDLKPANIGFDIRGDCKLFDFGLAKELCPDHKTSNDIYQISGLTGTRRYMAPEVCLCEPYNLTADVYSFAILFWEIWTLKKPFQKLDYEGHTKKVVIKGVRPKVKSTW